MKAEDKVDVKYDTGWKTGIIKKVTPKTYTIEFKGGETKRVNKQMEIRLSEASKPLVTASTSKPAKKKVTKKPVEKPVEKIVEATKKVEKFTEAVNNLPAEEKGFFKGKNSLKGYWGWIVVAFIVAGIAIAKAYGVF